MTPRPNFRRARHHVQAHAVAPPMRAYTSPGACSGTRKGAEIATPMAPAKHCEVIDMAGVYHG